MPIRLLRDLKKFVLRENLLNLAFGFTVGAAFTTLVRSLVDDVLMPPLGLLIGQTDLSDYHLVLRDGDAAAGPYATLEAAREAGAVTLNYGQFLMNVLTFALVAVAIFVLVRLITRAGRVLKDEFGRADDAADEPETKKCAYCRESVPFRAVRCAHCTSFLGTEGGPLAPDAALLAETTGSGGRGTRGPGVSG